MALYLQLKQQLKPADAERLRQSLQERTNEMVVLLPPNMEMAQPNILYECDRRACERCHAECHHTYDISHAVNFEKIATGTFVEGGWHEDGD